MTTAATLRRLARLAVESTSPSPAKIGSGRRRLDEAVESVTSSGTGSGLTFVVEHVGLGGDEKTTEIEAVNEADARTKFARTAPALGFGTHRVTGVSRVDEMRVEDVHREVVYRASLMFKKGVSASDVKPKFGVMKRSDREIFGGASRFATIHHDDDFILIHDPENKGSDGEFQMFDAEGGSYRLNPKTRKFVAEDRMDEKRAPRMRKTKVEVSNRGGVTSLTVGDSSFDFGSKEMSIIKSLKGHEKVITTPNKDKVGVKRVGDHIEFRHKSAWVGAQKVKITDLVVDGEEMAWKNANEDAGRVDEAVKDKGMIKFFTTLSSIMSKNHRVFGPLDEIAADQISGDEWHRMVAKCPRPVAEFLTDMEEDLDLRFGMNL